MNSRFAKLSETYNFDSATDEFQTEHNEGKKLAVLKSPTPPLTNGKPQELKTGNLLAFFNTWKCNAGVGIFAMPYLLQEAGLIPGICIFSALMLISTRSCLKLLKSAVRLYDGHRYTLLNHGIDKQMNYPEAAYLALGSWAKWVTIVSVIIGNFGACVSYIVFIKQNLARFFPTVFHSTEKLEEVFWVFAMSPLIFLLTCLKNMKYLAPASVLGTVALLGVTILVWIDVITKMELAIVATLISEPVPWRTWWVSFGIVSFMNEGLIGGALTIRKSMKNPEMYTRTLYLAMSLQSIVYLLFGFACCVLFFPNISSEITLDFPHTIIYEALVAIGCIFVLLTYPIAMYIVRIIVKEESSYWEEQSKYLDLLLFSAVIPLAVCVDKFGDFISIIGALGNSLNIFVLPSLMYLVVCKPTAFEILECIFVIFLGFCTMCVGVYGSISSLVNGG